MTNKSIEDIAQESQLMLWQAYCDKKMELESANDEIERLRATLRYIANDYVELSHDKVQWQRDDHMKMAKKALAESYKGETVEPKPLDDDF
jgi:hypothetical protein